MRRRKRPGHRLRQLRRGLGRFRRKHRWGLRIGVAALLLFVVYAAWLALRAEQALSRVTVDARAVSAAVAAGDDATLHERMALLHNDAATGEHRTDGPGWWLLGRLPVVGDDARGVRALAQVASELSTGNVEQLATRSAELQQVLPKQGRVDLQAVSQIAPVIAASRGAVVAASARLDAQSPAGFVEPLRSTYTELRTRVDQLSVLVQAADVAARVMPQMLGQDGPRHYILVLQNNAEIRASGGLPGAVSEVDANDGRLDISLQTSGAAFGSTQTPATPLSPEEQALYGDQLGNWFLDANFTPDFPRTAELMRARWEQVVGGDLDGVVSVDPIALSYLLDALGPVTVDGVQLTSANVVDELLHGAYVRLDAAGQDAFFRHVTKTIFDRLVAGAATPAKVAAALTRGVEEHRLLLHDFAPQVQDTLASTTVSGQLVKDAPDHPQVGVYFNDSTGGKMSYYLRYQTTITASSCSHGRQRLAGHLTIGSSAPADAASMPTLVTGGGKYGVPPGDQVVTVRLYGPLAGGISDVSLDGRPAAEQQTFDLDGRPVTKLWATLGPGDSQDITWSMTAGPGQTGTTYVGMTPSVVPGPSTATVASACS